MGIPKDMDIILNEGDAGSAWSGGRQWGDPKIITAIRRWIHSGGGFLGIGGPSAFEHQGRFFQLSDVMGVQCETGESISSPGLTFAAAKKHFILEDSPAPTLGDTKTNVFVSEPETAVLLASEAHVCMAARKSGKGRAVFMSGLPYSLENSRLLLRSLFWCAGRESELHRCFVSNPLTDCAVFEKAGILAVTNNSDKKESTVLYDNKGRARRLTLRPYELRWIN